MQWGASSRNGGCRTWWRCEGRRRLGSDLRDGRIDGLSARHLPRLFALDAPRRARCAQVTKMIGCTARLPRRGARIAGKGAGYASRQSRAGRRFYQGETGTCPRFKAVRECCTPTSRRLATCVTPTTVVDNVARPDDPTRVIAYSTGKWPRWAPSDGSGSPLANWVQATSA